MKIKKNLVAATAALLAARMAQAGCGTSNGGSADVQKTADGEPLSSHITAQDAFQAVAPAAAAPSYPAAPAAPTAHVYPGYPAVNPITGQPW